MSSTINRFLFSIVIGCCCDLSGCAHMADVCICRWPISTLRDNFDLSNAFDSAKPEHNAAHFNKSSRIKWTRNKKKREGELRGTLETVFTFSNTRVYSTYRLGAMWRFWYPLAATYVAMHSGEQGWISIWVIEKVELWRCWCNVYVRVFTCMSA